MRRQTAVFLITPVLSSFSATQRMDLESLAVKIKKNDSFSSNLGFDPCWLPSHPSFFSLSLFLLLPGQDSTAAFKIWRLHYASGIYQVNSCFS